VWEQLGESHTVIRFDRPGVGQSTRERNTFDLESEAHYLATVVDEVDLGPVSIFASSCGGPGSIAFAARRPDSVDRMILYSSYLDGTDVAPSETREALVAIVRSTWGSVGAKALADIFKPNASRSEVQQFAEFQRATASPDIAADLLQLTYDMNASEFAGDVRCPVLVVYRNGDRAIHPRCSRPLLESLPDVSLVELEGSAHMVNDGDSVALVREIERFLLGHSPHEFASRELVTVLFSDIVNSTPMATSLGDDAWRSRLDEHDRISTQAVEQLGGRVIKTTGDGVLATFPLPSQALACANALHRELASVGIQLTVGLHAGEVEVRGDDIAGIAVNIAARVLGQAASGQTLATSTVRDLSAGSGHSFVEIVTTELKGVDGSWTLCSTT
jgi:class 3 adenylate cyclase